MVKYILKSSSKIKQASEASIFVLKIMSYDLQKQKKRMSLNYARFTYQLIQAKSMIFGYYHWFQYTGPGADAFSPAKQK